MGVLGAGAAGIACRQHCSDPGWAGHPLRFLLLKDIRANTFRAVVCSTRTQARDCYCARPLLSAIVLTDSGTIIAQAFLFHAAEWDSLLTACFAPAPLA